MDSFITKTESWALLFERYGMISSSLNKIYVLQLLQKYVLGKHYQSTEIKLDPVRLFWLR